MVTLSCDIQDDSGEDSVAPDVRVYIKHSPDGIEISADGYNDYSTADGFMGGLLLLRNIGTCLRLYVWADINQEDPTHVIDLEDALEYKRKESMG